MSNENIERLLDMRHVGQKLEGQVDEQRDLKRTQENNISFEMKFRQICERAILAHKLEESTGEK